MYATYDYHFDWTIHMLFEHYDPIKVEKACQTCPNYDRIWSCPPLTFDVKTFMTAYKNVTIHIHKIEFEAGLSSDEKIAIFEKERQSFGNRLKESEDEGQQCLIAGHCYQCDFCTKIDNKPCIKTDNLRYSLEALGYQVGSIAKACGIPIQWAKGDEKTYYLTVGAMLKK